VKLQWGILSTGRIARRLAQALAVSQTGELAAVASRSLEPARAFAGEFDIPRAYGSYEELLADPGVQAVYLATPHPFHREWVIKAAEAGKHILCEKPAGMNAREVEQMLAAAKQHGVFFMEAFMYRCHPQTEKVIEILRSGRLGEVRTIECSFGGLPAYDPKSRLFAHDLGGGAILDIGCYCASMARLVAGVALGGELAEPLEIKAVGQLDPGEGTDLQAHAVLRFEGDICAHLSTSMVAPLENCVRVHGTAGVMTITQPWIAGSAGAAIILREYAANIAETISTEDATDLYAYELDAVARYQSEGEAPWPAMSGEDSLGNHRLLDAWREEIGLTYPADEVC